MNVALIPDFTIMQENLLDNFRLIYGDRIYIKYFIYGEKIRKPENCRLSWIKNVILVIILRNRLFRMRA